MTESIEIYVNLLFSWEELRCLNNLCYDCFILADFLFAFFAFYKNRNVKSLESIMKLEMFYLQQSFSGRRCDKK